MNSYLENDKTTGFYRYILLVFILLFVSLLSFSQTQNYEFRKPDFTSVVHTQAGMIISYTSGYILEEGLNFKFGMETGFVLGSIAGYWKEAQDPVFDLTDLSFTIIGAGAGWYLNSLIQKHYGLTEQQKLEKRLKKQNEIRSN